VALLDLFRFRRHGVQQALADEVVTCKCGKRHWHGAAATSAMSHFAVTQTLYGKNTDWIEPVSEIITWAAT